MSCNSEDLTMPKPNPAVWCPPSRVFRRMFHHRPLTLAVAFTLTAILLLAHSARAQDTNLFPGQVMTQLEAAQTNTGRIIIKAASAIGSVAAQGGTVAVICLEITDASTAHKDYGLTLSVFQGQEAGGSALVDYDELNSLLNGLDYLNRIDASVTSLASFDAFYVTKDGFRVAAFSSKRTGTVEFAVRTLRSGQRPAVLLRDQVAQLRNLIQQAKTKLNSLRASR